MSAIDRMRRAIKGAFVLWPWRPLVLRDPCVYCVLFPMLLRADQPRTLEHIQPLSAEGKDGWRNLIGACQTCNHERGSMPLLQYLIYRQSIQGLSGKAHRKTRAEIRRRLWRAA